MNAQGKTYQRGFELGQAQCFESNGLMLSADGLAFAAGIAKDSPKFTELMHGYTNGFWEAYGRMIPVVLTHPKS